MIQNSKTGIGKGGSLFHHPQADHTCQAEESGKGEVGRIPGADLRGNIHEDERNADEGSESSKDTNYCDRNGAVWFHQCIRFIHNLYLSFVN